MRRPANVLFDLDGTLTDSRPGIVASFRHALREIGAPEPPEEALTGCLGPPLADSFRRLLATDDAERVGRAIVLYRERFATRGIFENAVYPGVPAALERLRASGCRLFVATSKPRDFALRIVERFELAPFFAAVHGSEMDGRFADKGELLGRLLAEERLDPAATVMVGDREHDIAGARKNGLRALAVASGYGNRAELEAARPDWLCETIAEAADVLSGER